MLSLVTPFEVKMQPARTLALGAIFLFGAIGVRLPAQTPTPAQTPPQTPTAGQTAPGPGQGRGRGGQTFPAQQRPSADPALVAKGKGIYDVYCRACHGADLRGGDMGGPNLLRSPIALADANGESIGPVIKSGRQNPGMPVMPPLPLSDDDIKAVSAYIRSVLASAGRQGSPPEGEPAKLNIVVGDRTAGEKYFEANCASCHSATGDLKGIATRVADPTDLQNFWISGGMTGGRGGGRGGRGATVSDAPSPPPNRRQMTVTVTTPSGERVEGRLVRIDDFVVVLAGTDGMPRSFRRDGDVPKVDLKDPLDPHKKLLVSYTDKDIHDVTAYLVTLK